MQAVIGALRAVLGLDTVAFEQGIGKAQKELAGFNRDMQKIARDMNRIGKTMSVAITAPLVAAGALSLRAAANFEEAMGRVAAATGAAGKEFEALSEKAKEIGRNSQFSATEAAGAMEMLAKNGLNVAQILGGAADATVKLASANGAQLAPAADIVTDIMAQFSKGTGELGGVINQVTGTLIASKFGFDDYRLAIGQAGGVAGKVGVTFEDFNAALAVTSSSFASGSDAGTSFKTFLTKLVPTSDEAKEAMQHLKLSFFDSKGAMVSMEEAAKRLQAAFKPLGDEARLNLATKIFGTDSMRTALALADGGADALRRMREEIQKASAADQAAVRMKGFNGAVRTLKASLEALQIAIFDSGLLQWATDAAQALATLLQKVAALPPETLKWGAVVIGLTAAIGPLTVAIGALLGGFGKMALVLGRLLPVLAPVLVAIGGWIPLLAAAAVATVAFADKIALSRDGTVTLADAFNALAKSMRGANKELEAGKDNREDLPKELQKIEDAMSGVGGGDFDLGKLARAVATGLDAIVGMFKASFDVIVTIWKSLGPALADLGQQMLEGVRQVVHDWASGINDIVNWLRQRVGKDPLPMPPLAPWVNENKGAFERAGRDIAEAWNRGFEVTFFSDKVKAAIAAARDEALLRNAKPFDPFPESGTAPNAGAIKTPPPGGGTGGKGGKGGPGETNKKADDALKKLKEFLTEQERAIQLERMSATQRAVSEALYKAENLAKEAGIKLTREEREAIEANVYALESAKLATGEKQRLDQLAQQTIEETKTETQRYNDVLRDLNTLLQSGRISQEQFNRARLLAQENMRGDKGSWSTQWQEFADAVSGAAKSVAGDLLNMEGSVGDVLSRLGQRIAQFAMEILVLQPMFDAIGKMIKGALTGDGAAGGILGSILGALGLGGGVESSAPLNFSAGGTGQGLAAGLPGGWMPGFGGAMAGGGDVSPGKWYRVNERGMEAFMPEVPGQIISHRDIARMGSGGGNVNQVLNIMPSVEQTVRAQVRAMKPKIAEWGAEGALAHRSQGGNYKQRFARK